MTDNKILLPPQIIAINRINSEKTTKQAREQLKTGQQYDVDFGLRITGQLTVLPDTEFSQAKAPSQNVLLQILLSEFGPKKRVQVVERLCSAGLESLIQRMDGQPNLPLLADQLVTGLSQPQSVKRRGSVTGAVLASLVEWS